jgi:hypothetical protein
MNKVFVDINECFKTNLLTLAFKKLITYDLELKIVKKLMYYISCDNKHVTDISSITFLGLITDDALSWKSHID